jgi:molybdopterin-guanine dinucleotide biosynthesis protein A
MTGILGVILAGGGAVRMGGGDKCLLKLGGRPILAHVVERLAPQVDGVALSANGDPERFAGFGLPVLPDGLMDAGPLAGVLAGLDWAAARGARGIVTAAADTPFLPRDLVTALRAAAHAADRSLAMAMTPGEAGLDAHPTFGLWPVAQREELRTALAAGTRRLAAWAEARGCARAIFHDRGEPFFNVNTPEDLARARAMLASHP